MIHPCDRIYVEDLYDQYRSTWGIEVPVQIVVENRMMDP